MLVQPNQTIVQGHVRAVRPEADGWGADVDLDVLRNESPDPETDFLRPEPGSLLTVFAAEPEKLTPGEVVRVRVSLRADAFGERTVLEDVLPPADDELKNEK